MCLPSLIEQRTILIQKKSATSLGNVVIAGHIDAPIAEHLAHVAQPLGGKFKGPLKSTPSGSSEHGGTKSRQRPGLHLFLISKDLRS